MLTKDNIALSGISVNVYLHMETRRAVDVVTFGELVLKLMNERGSAFSMGN